MWMGQVKYETEFIKGSISKRFNVWQENYSKRFNVRQTICQVPFQSKLAKCPWIIVGANFIMYTKYTKNNRVKVDSIKTSQQILYFVSPLSSKSSLNVDHESTFFLQYHYQYRSSPWYQTKSLFPDKHERQLQTHCTDKFERQGGAICLFREGLHTLHNQLHIEMSFRHSTVILHDQLLHFKLLRYELLR